LFKTPNQMLKHTKDLAKQLSEVKKKEVAIGLPKSKATGKVYRNGSTIIEVGAKHEYGIGLPRRSFLRMPLAIKGKELGKAIESEYKQILENNKSVDKALGLIGARAYNIIQQAFLTSGFGQWQSLSDYTVAMKESSRILIDTGILKNAVTWVVRNAT